MRKAAIGIVAVAAMIGTPVLAADMPVKAPPPPPAPVYSWTGFYVGANLGGGWGSRSVIYSPNDPVAAGNFFPLASTSFSSSGVIGGVQLGYNWQFDRNWLVGLEADYDGSNMRGQSSSSMVAPVAFTTTVNERIDSFGTVRGRLGYLPTDNLLAYFTGGFAYGKIEHTASWINNGAIFHGFTPTVTVICATTATCLTGSSSGVSSGWTLGGGLEYALWKNVTVKAEYIYVSLASRSVTETAILFIGGTTPASFNANYGRTNFNVARAGLNYRF